MNKKHEKAHDCILCAAKEKEEIQFAAIQLNEDSALILDAEEVSAIDTWFNVVNQDKEKLPVKVELDEDTPVLAYGVLIPQYNNDTPLTEWKDVVESYKNYAFATLEDWKEHTSAYEDIILFDEDIVFNNRIPCAFLLSTSLDLRKEKEYGFGYTMFLRYSNVEIMDNILNRQFIFCVKGIEEGFDSDRGDWKEQIDKHRAIDVARTLI